MFVMGGDGLAIHVLGVGYAYDEYDITATGWKKYDIEFDYADNIRHIKCIRGIGYKFEA